MVKFGVIKKLIFHEFDLLIKSISKLTGVMAVPLKYAGSAISFGSLFHTSVSKSSLQRSPNISVPSYPPKI